MKARARKRERETASREARETKSYSDVCNEHARVHAKALPRPAKIASGPRQSRFKQKERKKKNREVKKKAFTAIFRSLVDLERPRWRKRGEEERVHGGIFRRKGEEKRRLIETEHGQIPGNRVAIKKESFGPDEKFDSDRDRDLFAIPIEFRDAVPLKSRFNLPPSGRIFLVSRNPYITRVHRSL